MNPLNRRNFLFTSSGAAGSLLVPGLAEADEAGESPHAGSGLITGTPKPLKHKEVPGFLSAAQISPHHTAHYGGALKAFAAADARFEEGFTKGTAIDPAAFERLKQIQSSRGNSVILHELYFDGLALKAAAPPEGIRRAVEKRFGSLDKWAADFVASAKAAEGWAMLVAHPVNGRLYNVVSDEHAQGPLWLAAPLVVIDVYEHAFYVDYRNNKAEYVEKFLTFADWAEAEKRYRAVVKG
ncbi:superoxide dismutase [Gemmata sp.]|uniref:superoxide dismutase n=1 Tax=Gemmata sp. TaxID=1914242 RepID=UPI003F711B12